MIPKERLLAGTLLLGLLFARCATQRADLLGSYLTLVDSPEPPVLRRIEPATLSAYAYKTLDYGIAPWFRFKPVAVSLTFDDGTLDQYLLAYPELERRNIKATFFVLTEPLEEGYWQDCEDRRLLFSWDHAREMAVSGHEIGSHSKNHASLLGNDSSVEEQLRDSQAKINREVRSRRCVSFCWPFWKSNGASRSLAERYYICARAGGPIPTRYPLKNGGIITPNPYDLYQINCMGILDREQFTAWKRVGDQILAKSGWAVINLHGIDDGKIDRGCLGWKALSIGSFRELLDHIAETDGWIAPFGRVARYIQERQAANIRLLDIKPECLFLSLTDNLDDAIFDQALTVKLKLTGKWRRAEVRQNGQIMWSRLEEEGFLLFDAFPDRGPIVITKLE
jgi:peptidoglycan/xylan/chitin deacetylase (PgdA/CDA1 family)